MSINPVGKAPGDQSSATSPDRTGYMGGRAVKVSTVSSDKNTSDAAKGALSKFTSMMSRVFRAFSGKKRVTQQPVQYETLPTDESKQTVTPRYGFVPGQGKPLVGGNSPPPRVPQRTATPVGGQPTQYQEMPKQKRPLPATPVDGNTNQTPYQYLELPNKPAGSQDQKNVQLPPDVKGRYRLLPNNPGKSQNSRAENPPSHSPPPQPPPQPPTSRAKNRPSHSPPPPPQPPTSYIDELKKKFKKDEQD